MEFPSGFRFKPTDVEIIEDYLLNKVKEKPTPYEIVSECELYNKNGQPWKKAFQKKDRRTEENTRFFFTKVKKISKNGKRKNIKRTTGSATWKSQKATTIYNQLGKVIGTKTAFSYIEQGGSSSERWVMHEYSLDGEYENLEKEVQNYVLCKVTRKELLNKAQIKFENNIIPNTEPRQPCSSSLPSWLDDIVSHLEIDFNPPCSSSLPSWLDDIVSHLEIDFNPNLLHFPQ